MTLFLRSGRLTSTSSTCSKVYERFDKTSVRIVYCKLSLDFSRDRNRTNTVVLERMLPTSFSALTGRVISNEPEPPMVDLGRRNEIGETQSQYLECH